MSIEMVVILLLVVLVVAGAAVGVVLVLRTPPTRGAALEANPLVPRVVCELHAGEEQVLIHLARALALPIGRDDADYGQIYLAGSTGTTMRLATRSEIGRGFDAEIRVRREAHFSVAEYFVLQLPGDETVLRRIAGLDEDIATAAIRFDPRAVVRVGGRRHADRVDGTPA